MLQKIGKMCDGAAPDRLLMLAGQVLDSLDSLASLVETAVRLLLSGRWRANAPTVLSQLVQLVGNDAARVAVADAASAMLQSGELPVRSALLCALQLGRGASSDSARLAVARAIAAGAGDLEGVAAEVVDVLTLLACGAEGDAAEEVACRALCDIASSEVRSEGVPVWKIRDALAAVGSASRSDVARRLVAEAMEAVAQRNGGRQEMARDNVLDSLARMGESAGGSEAKEAVCRAIAAISQSYDEDGMCANMCNPATRVERFLSAIARAVPDDDTHDALRGAVGSAMGHFVNMCRFTIIHLEDAKLPLLEHGANLLAALGRGARTDEAREGVCDGIALLALADSDRGEGRFTDSPELRDVVLTLGSRSEGTAAREASCDAVWKLAGNYPTLMATREVRDLLVAIGRDADSDRLCMLTAAATVELAQHDAGLVTPDVRDVLVGLGRRVGPCTGARDHIAVAVATIAKLSPEGLRLVATEAVREVLVALGATGGPELYSVVNAVAAIAVDLPGRQLMATADVRDLLLTLGRGGLRNDGGVEVDCEAVVRAVRAVASGEDGRRLLARDSVCAMLERMLASRRLRRRAKRALQMIG